MELDDNEMKENSTESESEMERMLIRVEETYDYIWRMYLKFKVTKIYRNDIDKQTLAETHLLVEFILFSFKKFEVTA